LGTTDNKAEKQAMVFKVCLRSGLGAAFIGLVIGLCLIKFPELPIVAFCCAVAGIGGIFIGLFSSTRNLTEFVNPSLIMADFAGNISEGDLTHSVDNIDTGYMAMVAGKLNDMAAKLRNLIGETNNVTQVIVSSSQIPRYSNKYPTASGSLASLKGCGAILCMIAACCPN
jgi:methyl-accepting chemotaxis protein